MSTTRERLLGFLQSELLRGQTDIDLESDSLVETGVIDSVGIMKLVDYLERELGVTVTDDELLPENFDTLDAVVSLVETKS